MSVTLNGTSGLVFGDGTTQGTAAGMPFRNRIINGAMMIDQRYAGTATANNINGYTLDRWNVGQTTTGKLIAQQNAGSVTPPVGFTNYLGVTSQSAYSVISSDFFGIYQNIEGFNTADLNWGSANAKTVTLSFWVRSSLTGTFGGSVKNSAGDRSYPFSYTISVANTWEQKSITIIGDTTGTWLTTNGRGISLIFALGIGSTQSGTAGAWASGNYSAPTGATSVVGTSGATFYITGVQLEKGSTATSFDYRPYGTELALCQRYYQTMKPPLAVSAEGVNNTLLVCAVSYPVRMRTTPTVSQSGVFAYELPYGNKSTQSAIGAILDAATTNNVGAVITLINFSSLVFSRTYRPEANNNELLFSAEM